MPYTPGYPTREHERAAGVIVDFFTARDETDAVLLVNSCARGKARDLQRLLDTYVDG